MQDPDLHKFITVHCYNSPDTKPLASAKSPTDHGFFRSCSEKDCNGLCLAGPNDSCPTLTSQRRRLRSLIYVQNLFIQRTTNWGRKQGSQVPQRKTSVLPFNESIFRMLSDCIVAYVTTSFDNILPADFTRKISAESPPSTG